MRAIRVGEDGGLSWEDVPTPAPGPGEVLLRVRATAVNRADLVQRAGHYPPPRGESEILGLEAAGQVEAVGEGAVGWAPGDAACALLAGGGYAQAVVVPQGQLLPLPAGLSFEEAAALPEVLATAWLNLYLEGGLKPGERVLLHAGASGVGTAAIQLCRARGNPCFVLVGSPEKVEACRALGADDGFVRHEGPWREAVRAWAPSGVDLVLDPVGAATLACDLAVLGTGGRLVVIGLMGGREATLDLGRLMVKRLRIIGSVLRSRSRDEKARICASLCAEVWPLLEAGQVRPILDRVLPMAQVEEAHAVLRRNENVGKVVLRVS